jgi:hypothetical protein
MDTKVIMHKAIVREIVEEIGAMLPPEEDGVENQTIIDDKNGHYLILGVGWEHKKWFYANFLHIDVKADGKVWLHHNGMDIKVVDELESKGIAKSDIVLAFHSKDTRQYTGYAVS